MDNEKIAKMAKDLKESNAKVATFLLEICDFLKDHEVRLQALENPDLKGELKRLQHSVMNIEDPAKKTIALALLRELCDTFGVNILEAP